MILEGVRGATETGSWVRRPWRGMRYSVPRHKALCSSVVVVEEKKNIRAPTVGPGESKVSGASERIGP